MIAQRSLALQVLSTPEGQAALAADAAKGITYTINSDGTITMVTLPSASSVGSSFNSTVSAGLATLNSALSGGTAAPSNADFQVTGRPSQFGTGTLLTPGAVPALDAMLRNDNVVNQIGVLYGLNKNYGVQDSAGGKEVTEFFGTLNGNSAASKTLYSGSVLSLSTSDFNSGGWKAAVTPSFTPGGDLVAVAHTHPINGVPSDGHDFSFQVPALSSRGIWSVVVTPTTIYFTGPQQGQYYYLPASAFTSAGQANGKTVTIPAEPHHGP